MNDILNFILLGASFFIFLESIKFGLQFVNWNHFNTFEACS